MYVYINIMYVYEVEMYIASKNLTLWHFETNLSMPEEVAFILRKSRVNTDVPAKL